MALIYPPIDTSSESPNLRQALSYAAVGMPIFPVQVSWNTAKQKWDKAPFIKGWQTDASSNPTTIEKWWRQYPQALPGIALGKADLVVIDPDRHPGGADGVAAFGELVAKHKELKPHPICNTAGGGNHHYFKQLPGMKIGNSPGNLPDGIDVRGDVGFVVAPGAIRQDGKRWEPAGLCKAFQEGTIPFIPDWLALIIQPPKAKAISKQEKGAALNRKGKAAALAPTWTPDEEARVREALKYIPADDRNREWFSVGAALHSTGWESAREMWDEWSVISSKFDKPDQDKTWEDFDRPFNRERITLGTLFHIAKEHGWKPERRPSHSPRSADIVTPDGAIVTFEIGTDGKPKSTCANARIAIEALGLKCQYDLFHERLTVQGHAVDRYGGEFSDHAGLALRRTIEEVFKFDPGGEKTHDAFVQICLQHACDPICDYLDSLLWDGKKRLDTWMSVYLGAEDTKLNRAISRLALLAMVKRARHPGCKFDQIIVLEGPEGGEKSTSLLTLAGGNENFSDQTILGTTDQQQQERSRGKWVYEIGDMAGMKKAEAEQVKAFASRTHDRARPAYGRQQVELPRRCVFFGTTNDATYLKSRTGNRRFWPVRVGRINIESLRQDRDQLFAEAATLEAEGASLILPQELWNDAGEAQKERLEHDPWVDRLADVRGAVSGMEERISSGDLLEKHLGIPIERQNDIMTKRLGYAMRELGWEGPGVMWDALARKTIRGYRRGVRREPN
jgi:Virulence-associated protein E/Bifunctional DNA primase/polymerase, N-terminal/Primase C terminal 2 (PriCT-2)